MTTTFPKIHVDFKHPLARSHVFKLYKINFIMIYCFRRNVSVWYAYRTNNMWHDQKCNALRK